jgi:hypothetical protein
VVDGIECAKYIKPFSSGWRFDKHPYKTPQIPQERCENKMSGIHKEHMLLTRLSLLNFWL